MSNFSSSSILSLLSPLQYFKSDVNYDTQLPTEGSTPSQTLTHDWSFDHGIPTPTYNRELLSWLQLFRDLPGTFHDSNTKQILYRDIPCTSTFTELVDHANRFVHDTHDRDACCQYASQEIQAGHTIDRDLTQRHMQMMRDHGILETCRHIQNEHRDSYLQPELVRSQYNDFPEYLTLLQLAVEGAHIITPTDWIPNSGVGVKLRPNAKRMAMPIQVRFAQEQALGDVIIVDSTEFQKYATECEIPFNVISVDWVFKPGNKQSDLLGRLIDDYTNCDAPLNTPETFTSMEAVFGELTLPQLPDMCRSVLLARERFPHEKIMGLKEDISRAYRRVRLHPPSCMTMVLLLPPTADGISYYAIRLSQPFGHNASAHGWGVVARALEFKLSLVTCPAPSTGLFGMYVDDLFAFGSRPFLKAMSHAFTEASHVAGTGARAVDKSEICDMFQSLGWLFVDDLDAVFPNTKGWMNMLSLFFTVIPWHIKPGDKLPVLTLLRAGSYASRYSNAFYSMRPFCHGFYGNVRGASPYTTRKVSARTVHDISVWRFFLCMAYHQPSILSVPIAWPVILQYNPEEQARHADRVVYVDASLSHFLCGAYIEGLAWCQFQPPVQTYMSEGSRTTVSINVLEMMGVLVGVLIAITEQPSITHLHVWCDNSSSVAWADSQRTNSTLLSFLLQLLTLLGASRRVLFTVGWIKGARNVMADAISRQFLVTNGDNLQATLLHQTATCPQAFLHPTFSQGIKTVSRLRHNETSTIIRCVHTVMVGINTSGSASSSALNL